MSHNDLTLAKQGCHNLSKLVPQDLFNKLEFLNVVNTYIIVIEGKDEYAKLKNSLEQAGFSDFDLKVENDMHTLVFQMNGFNVNQNIIDLLEMEKMVEMKEDEKIVEMKEDKKIVEMKDFMKQINELELKLNGEKEKSKELELKLNEEKEKNKEMQMSSMIPEPIEVKGSFEIDELKRELETEKIKVKSFIDKQFNLEMENENFKEMLDQFDDLKQNISNLNERNEVLKQTISKLSEEKESLGGQQCEVCLTNDQLKQTYVDRELLSNKIREYVKQDSRVPFLLSMAGLNNSIFEGDILGNFLQI